MPNRKTSPKYIAMVWAAIRKNGKESNAPDIFKTLQKQSYFPNLSEDNVLEILNNMLADGFLVINTDSRQTKLCTYIIPSITQLEQVPFVVLK